MALGTCLKCPTCGKFYPTITDLYDGGGRLYGLGIVQKAKCGECGSSWTIRGPLEIVNHKTNYQVQNDPRDPTF
jgi:hypothetical protein